MIRVFVGYDCREVVAYHAFCESVIQHTTAAVSFCPLSLKSLQYDDKHKDGSNAFTYSRFLVPYLCDYDGWALFVDGDMLCRDDLRNLWNMRDYTKAVQVVQHDYKTKHPEKYLGAKNEDYPRKNWSSVVLWNCGHPSNHVLKPKFIADSTGEFLHRFKWLHDSQIGDLPAAWNWLVGEYDYNEKARIAHFTLGIPAFPEYDKYHYSDEWHATVEDVNYVQIKVD